MDSNAKKQALRGITYGLYVIGTKSKEGVPNAFTGNWLTQTSFEPPLVALAVKADTRSKAEIAETGVFSVNVLASGQKDMAVAFFKSVEPEGQKLGGYEFVPGTTGCPVFKDALRYFECQVVDKIERGDHWIYVAEVVEAGVHREGEPLTMKETGFNYGG